MKLMFPLIVLSTMLMACQEKEQISLLFENANGLSKESTLQINGYKIGEVESLKQVDQNQTLVQVFITENIDIPNDSKFILQKQNILGETAINVSLGNSETMISSFDTIVGYYDNKPTVLEDKIQKLARSLIALKDSLVVSNLNYDYQVGLKFINEYLDFINKSQSYNDVLLWVEKREDVSESFKFNLNELIEKGLKDDPDLGLGFDPILNAQDNPNEFILDTLVGEYLFVKGLDWENFKVVIKLKKTDTRILVDGSGVINIPKEFSKRD